MANVKLFDQTGKEVSTVELNDAIFGIEPNESVVFDVVISQRASLRQGTHAVKNRSAGYLTLGVSTIFNTSCTN